MPADEISGINLIVAQGGTAITDQTDATLTSTPELAESVVKNTNFPNRVSGDQDWQVEFEGQIPNASDEDVLTNGNAALKVKVDATDDNTDNPALETVPGLQSLALTLSQELQTVPPGINEATGWQYYVPLRQSWEVDPEGHYYDPEGGSEENRIFRELHAKREAGENVDAEIDVLGVTFDGTLAADDMEIAAGTDDPASQSLPFMGSGEVTRTSSFESTIESLVDLYFTQSTATIALQYEEGGTIVSSSTIWEGEAYLSECEITLERNSFPTLSATLQGSGPLSRVVN